MIFTPNLRIGRLMHRILLAFCAAALLGGCQLFGGALDTVEPVAVVAPRLPSRPEEVIGARENPRVVAEYGGVYSDPEVEEAIAKVVSRVVAASDDPSRTYKVTILNSPVANAFALPGGYLYVTRGLIALTNDSSELAAVLSHEMAHVLLDHAIQRARIVEQNDIVERVATDVLSDPDESQSARAGSRLSLATFSRNQEVEADRIGITIAGRAGFDPFAASRFLDKLESYAAFRSALGNRDDAASFLASHPAALERRELALVVARQFGAPGIGERTQDGYLKALDGMVYGDDPSEGFVRGREFLHPRLAIGFRVPPDFRLENTKEAVLAAAGENTAMRFDGVAVEADAAPADYLASGWINGLVDGSIRATDVNRLPAATAEAAAGEWVFRIGAVRVGGSMYRLIFADRGDGAGIEQAMQETLASFHRLTPSEVARLRPLRVNVVSARSGDTPASLALRMEGTERKLELFRLLNGLGPEDAVVPGQPVKLVSD
ncbi:MAG: M48 family metalloprotease [Pseudomonadota bacterium]|nr:M48 family metalloprotease [Pseudomonadota bacterium]